MTTDPSAETTTSTATGTPTNWEETPSYGTDAPLPRLAQAEVTFAYEGDLQGTGECRYLFRYGPTGDSEILGFEHVEGALRGRTGSFNLRHEGTFTEGRVQAGATTMSPSASSTRCRHEPRPDHGRRPRGHPVGGAGLPGRRPAARPAGRRRRRPGGPRPRRAGLAARVRRRQPRRPHRSRQRGGRGRHARAPGRRPPLGDRLGDPGRAAPAPPAGRPPDGARHLARRRRRRGRPPRRLRPGRPQAR